MNEAYEWLCQARLNYSSNADIWDLRQHWTVLLPLVQRQLLAGKFQFSVQTQYRFADETKVVWAAIDSLVLKCIAIVLTPFLSPLLSKRCFNIKGHGVLKPPFVRRTRRSGSINTFTEVIFLVTMHRFNMRYYCPNCKHLFQMRVWCRSLLAV